MEISNSARMHDYYGHGFHTLCDETSESKKTGHPGTKK